MDSDFVAADTDLIIDFLRRSDPGRTWVRDRIQKGRLRITAISAFEVRLGQDFISRRGDVASLLRRRTLPLDAQAALAAGALFVDLRSRGLGIDFRDSLIAGICLRFQTPLATRNVRHFERVSGLSVVRV